MGRSEKFRHVVAKTTFSNRGPSKLVLEFLHFKTFSPQVVEMNPHIFDQNGSKPIYPFCVTHRYSLHKTLPREASSSLDKTHPGTFVRICECRIFLVLLLTDILFNFFFTTVVTLKTFSMGSKE